MLRGAVQRVVTSLLNCARIHCGAAVEEDFAFHLDRNRVQGRYDLLVERAGEVSVLDFKTGAVDDASAA